MNMTNLAKFAAVLSLSAAALPAVTAPASAVVAAFGFHTFSFTFSPPGSLLPIAIGAGTSVAFTLPAQANVAVTFSAECSVEAPAGDFSSYVDVDVLIDGVAVPPTAGTSDAFCSANGTAGFDSWVRPSITVVKLLAAGPHSVSVFGRPSTGATRGYLGITSVVVER
jgi:hypothetical protein